MKVSRPRHTLGGRLALLDSLRRAERRAAVSRIVSVIAHLIGTPLHVIAGRAALIRSNPTPESALDNARRIEQQVEQLASRIRNLIEYLSRDEPAVEPRLVTALVTDALALYSPIATRQGLEIASAGAPPGTMVDGSSALIVLTSLLSLALQTASSGARIELCFELLPGDQVVFQLSIPGLSLPIVQLDRLDPPEARDSDPEPLQILSVCNAIAHQSGGRLALGASPQGKTAIRFECPTVA